MANDKRLRGWTGTEWVPLRVDAEGRLYIDQPIGGGGGDAWVEAVSFKVIVPDTIAAPTDDPTFAIALLQDEPIAVPTEAVQLAFPSGNFDDAVAAPIEANSMNMRIWLSGTTATGNGATNPNNVNSQNDAVLGTLQSAVAGAATNLFTSAVGANVPAGVSIAAAIYRGWFRSNNTLGTSTGQVILRSIGALFADKIMFTNAAVTTDVNHLTGTFTYDLVANGITTAALLASCQIIHTATDAVAGVTPHAMTVDAGCIELAGAF